MNTEWTVGRKGYWKPYFFELRLDGELIEQRRFWTLWATMVAIADYESR